MTETENGLPALPDGWVWEAIVSKDSVTVMVRNENVTIGSRTGDCFRADRKNHISRLAKDLWRDLNEAAQLSADLGITILYD